jgi:hypothetical protein
VLAVADVSVVDPHAFVDRFKLIVQKIRSQMRIVLRVIDYEEVPVVF